MNSGHIASFTVASTPGEFGQWRQLHSEKKVMKYVEEQFGPLFEGYSQKTITSLILRESKIRCRVSGYGTFCAALNSAFPVHLHEFILTFMLDDSVHITKVRRYCDYFITRQSTAAAFLLRR